jgi:O-methyltransferase involved in polyketide biosynthesis
VAIQAKQRVVKRLGRFDHVEYLPIDLNDDAWPELERWLGARPTAKSLAVMEGVSPYVNEHSFAKFLSLLRDMLPNGSQVAFDFKLSGANDGFGCAGRTDRPFRLSGVREDVAAFHEALGYRLAHLELSSALSMRLLPGLGSGAPLFREDALVQLEIGEARSNHSVASCVAS